MNEAEEQKPAAEARRITFENGEIKAGGETIAFGLANEDVERVRGEMWRENFYKNLPLIKNAPDTSMLHGLFSGKETMCICVGNGPSFHENMETLKMMQEFNPPFIMAADRVFNALRSNGIGPDLTMSLDGQRHVADFFDKDLVCADDFFVSMIYTHHDVVKIMNRGKIFWSGLAVHRKKCGDGFERLVSPLWDEFYSQCGTRFYNTVANYVVGDAMTRLACHMGFKVVVSLGNDLSFKEVDKENGDKFEERYNKYMIEFQGDTYITCEPFLLAAMKMSEMPKIYPKTKLVDCSNAPIAEWDKMPFSDLGFFTAFHEHPYDVMNYRWEMLKRHKFVYN